MFDRQKMAHFIYLSAKAYLRMIIKLKNRRQVFFANHSQIIFSHFFSIANYAGWAITYWPFGGEDATP
jgi:hypothetical protein